MILTLLCVVATGCASSGAEVVDGADEELLEQMTRFEVEEREIQFSAADTEVHATLTTPRGETGVPAVVLVAGSGPTDRDWNNPLLPGDNGTAIELSDRLAQAGIAVLRYDKRGTGHTQLPGPIAWDDYLAEVQMAVETVAAEEAVDEERIILAGHSEGGAHALRAVSEGLAEVDGLILLATAGRPMRDLVLSQVNEQLEGAGLNDEAVTAELASLRRAMDAISRREQVEAEHVSDIPGLVALVETLQTEDAAEFAAALLPWDPAAVFNDIDAPVLILSGLKDTQVDPREDASRLFEAAQQSNENAEMVLIEDADHVLKHQVASKEELGAQHSLVYNDPTRNLDRAVLTALVRWIHEL